MSLGHVWQTLKQMRHSHVWQNYAEYKDNPAGLNPQEYPIPKFGFALFYRYCIDCLQFQWYCRPFDADPVPNFTDGWFTAKKRIK